MSCDAATMRAFLLDMAVPAIATQNTANLMEAVTGLKFSAEEVQAVGERINNLARAFNARRIGKKSKRRENNEKKTVDGASKLDGITLGGNPAVF